MTSIGFIAAKSVVRHPLKSMAWDIVLDVSLASGSTTWLSHSRTASLPQFAGNYQRLLHNHIRVRTELTPHQRKKDTPSPSFYFCFHRESCRELQRFMILPSTCSICSANSMLRQLPPVTLSMAEI